MDISFFQFFWYCIVYIALFAFAALDGFDLGVGILHLIARNDNERRVFLNSIGPVWDGNAVWLVIVTGGLLAGFPIAFATIFSSYYIPTSILVSGIIFRAVGIEFRSKRTSKLWRQTWDFLFFISSLIITVVVGFILAGLTAGLPIGNYGVFQGDFKSFFSLYTIIFAITVVSLFAMHGIIYLLMKTEKSLQVYLKKWAVPLTFFYIFCAAILTLNTWFLAPQITQVFLDKPWLASIGGLEAICLVLTVVNVLKDNYGYAFIASSATILVLFSLCAIGNFPVIVRSTINPIYSLTISNASSSPKTLQVLFLIAVIGVPFVLAYSYWLYRIFKGKVKIDSHSY